MLINSKKILNNYLKTDYARYPDAFSKKRIIYFLEKDYIYLITKYIKYLRYSEYYFNTHKKIRLAIVRRKRNNMDRKLNLVIPLNTTGPGLLIEHGNVIMNQGVKIGKNCTFHGFNVIGSKANGSKKAPQIGDNFNIGVHSSIIGEINITNDVFVGAHTFINKDIKESGIYVGSPFRKIK